VARRYGVRPSAILGVDPDADEAERIRAYDVDRAAALAGLWQEREFLQQATTTTARRSARRPAAEPSFSPKEGLRGRIPVSNEPVPDWLERHFPEGPIKRPPTA
jgi:hypothetical protein